MSAVHYLRLRNTLLRLECSALSLKVAELRLEESRRTIDRSLALLQRLDAKEPVVLGE